MANALKGSDLVFITAGTGGGIMADDENIGDNQLGKQKVITIKKRQQIKEIKKSD
ncbi:unnamed protein product [Dovyalis caffra]|uniref:Uncharacterized protein n=1 Tax=Dovyalis caffra TaxID=77055 RepID=A0AAV1QSF4_9ROSI|nr:unnamed protein product [Dovyalis caffra]